MRIMYTHPFIKMIAVARLSKIKRLNTYFTFTNTPVKKSIETLVETVLNSTLKCTR